VGTRLWELLNEGKQPREAYQVLLSEYEVDASVLEQDVLELLTRMMESGLVEISGE